MTQYKGFVFSLPREMIKRAMSEGQDVFVKYCSWAIEPGHILYLYDTGEGGSRQIIAEAKISAIHKIPAKEVCDKYGSRMFPTKEEFEEYISGRESKEITVAEVTDLTYLDEPIDPPGNITVAGLTLDEERYQFIQDQI